MIIFFFLDKFKISIKGQEIKIAQELKLLDHNVLLKTGMDQL